MTANKAAPLMTVDVAVPILQKRADWLGKRLEAAEATGKVLAYDRLELYALQIAIETLEKTANSGDKDPSAESTPTPQLRTVTATTPS